MRADRQSRLRRIPGSTGSCVAGAAFTEWRTDMQHQQQLVALVRQRPARASAEAYRQRVRAKRFAQRWPGVVVFDAVN